MTKSPETLIILPDMDAWDVFATANRDALIEAYGSLDNALQHATQGGLTLGGIEVCFDGGFDQ